MESYLNCLSESASVHVLGREPLKKHHNRSSPTFDISVSQWWSRRSANQERI